MKAIIVEGPDGSGKSTLIETISRDMDIPMGPRFATSLGGPLDGLGYRVEREAATWNDKPVKIYDRHPLVSDYIYGPILRGGVDESLLALSQDLVNLIKRNTMLVLCLPPYEVVRDNVMAEESMGQLSGVAENIGDIYDMYSQLEFHPQGWNIVLHDYTDSQYLELRYDIEDYLEN